jgi:hypothetical protein
MDVPIGAQVYCENEPWGQSTQVILNRLTNQVTHIVVQRDRMTSASRKVPIEWLEGSTPSRLFLGCGRAELAKCEYVQGEFTSSGPTKPKTSQAGSPSELAIKQGAWVEAWDRYAGLIDGFLVDPSTYGITHIVLSEMHLWGDRKVVVPVSAISCIQEDRVRLDLDIDNVEELQSVLTEPHNAYGFWADRL